MNVKGFGNVQWECVHFHSHFSTELVENELIGNQFFFKEIDCEAIHTDKKLLDAIAKAMQFPDYFSQNFDALDECLRDLAAWLPAKGYVLILQNSSCLWKSMPLTTGRLVQSWLSCAEEWSISGTPFHLVFTDLRKSGDTKSGDTIRIS